MQIDSKIIKNENALSTEFMPEILPHRESQIQFIAKNLEPASRGRKPQNIFINGPPGIGKTASIKFVFKQFEEYSGIRSVYINTWDYSTSSALLTKITTELGIFVQRRGISKDEIIERLVDGLKKVNKGVIICLDEIDQLIKKDEGALYDLLRLNQYVENPIGIVAISNYKNIFLNLEPRIMSSLDLEEISFKPYTLDEMKSILNERCKDAFKGGVVEDGVVLLCANHAITRGGDVRVGLECLRKASRLAEDDNSEKITVYHVKSILLTVKSVKMSIIKGNVEGVDRSIVDLLETGDDITSTNLREIYSKKYGNISHVAFRKHLNYLKNSGIIKERKTREGSRGRKVYISLVKRKVFK